MILQCDQCNTKFRLDDSKLKPGGVKVRCSKCRHVFVAGAEQKPEDSDFDAILSGLGAPAPLKAPEAAAVSKETAGFSFEEEPAAERATQGAAGEAGADFSAFEFGAEPAEPQLKPATALEQELAGFDFTSEPPCEAETAAKPLDYGEFDFSEEPPALKEEREPPSGESFDFGEVHFAAGPAIGGPQPAPEAAGLDFGEFEFDEEPAAPAKEPSAAPESLDFGDFSFPEESAPAEAKPAPAAAEALEFGEFSFEEESAPLEEKSAPAVAEALDFGDFSFEEESAPREETPPPAAAGTLDFGEFSFEEESEPGEETPAPAAAGTLDFGEFSFEEEVAPKEEKPAPAAADALDFGDFSFEEEPPLIKEAPVPEAPDDLDSFASQGQLHKKEEPAPPEPDEEFSFGGFTFTEEPEPEPLRGAEAVPPAGAAGPAGAAALLGATGTARPEPAAAPVPPAAGAKPAPQESPLDFSFGEKSFGTALPEEFPGQEELPPLSIASRRKGRSALTVTIVAICVVVVVALSGAGLYLLQSGPDALEKFDKLGIGFVAKWFGMETPEEGRITISKPLAAFHQNREAGELFVVTGEAVNSYRKARASIQVKVSIFDKNGKVLVQKTAYCGNRLSNEQLATLPMEKIESIMNNQFGDSLSNLGVKPGQPIGFVVALANVPKEAADFGVEVVSSTVAGQN